MMRERLMEVAEELLIKQGYHSVSFRDVAEIVNTTRANMHYHFSTKSGLVEAVLEDYTRRTVASYTSIWNNGSTTLEEKINRTIEFMRDRYERYNTDGERSAAWSLTTRLYSDWDALTPKMQESLQYNISEFESLVRIGVALAVREGELLPETPQDMVSIQLSNIILQAAHVTRGRYSFSGLVQLWGATWSTIRTAYGPSANTTAVA